MKRITIAICVMLLAFNASAQKCKLSIDKKDAVTGEISRLDYFKFNRGYFFYISRTGQNYHIELEYSLLGEENFAIPAGEELPIKLTDGTIFKLTTLEKTTPTSAIIGSTVITIFHPKYSISKEQLEKIAASGGIVAISPKIKSYNLSREFTKKEIQKSIEIARCITLD